ncbi:MAG: GGDEF domain-containing protein [Candidatus Dormibacteraeota bacterium]|nr:GGDEF domain-containing protein [Candidatus Dormibacteraeota bacterium]
MISAATNCMACGAAMASDAIYCSNCATAREDPNTRALFVVDGTTGLFNDAFTGALVDHETSRAIRYRRPLTVLVAMVDHADFITQDLGDASRNLFRELADVIAGSVRDIDTVGYLGDRFCLVLPETDQAGAVVAAEKLMHTVASHQYLDGGQWGRVTISVGAASVGYDRMDKQDLVELATQALLEGRGDGSNRVHVAHRAN